MKKPVLLFLLVVLPVLLSAQSVPAYVSQSSLLAWYPFSGNADNAFGTGKNGSVMGPVLTNDRFGNPNSAYHFNGMNDHVTIDTPCFNVGWPDYTISLWESLDTLDNPYVSGQSQMVFNTMRHNGIVISLNWGNTGHYMFFANSNPALVYTWNILNHDTSVAPLVVHDWNHLVFRKKNDTSYSFYLNGSLDRTFNRSTTALNYYCKMIFGRIDTSYPAEAFMGKLDDYGIWSRALAECEIKRLFRSTAFTYINTQPTDVTTYPGATVSFVEVDTGGTGYQWQMDAGSGFADIASGAPYSGVTTPTLTITGVTAPMFSNKYRCVVSGAQVCVDTSDFARLIMTTDAPSNISFERISIAPNPTTGLINVSGVEKANIRVFNVLGEMVKEVKEGKSVSIAEFPAGCYLLRLSDETGQCYFISRVIKQ